MQDGVDAEAQPLFQSKSISEEPEEIRAGFIAKVYGILTVQLLVTATIAAPFVLSAGIRTYVETDGYPLVILASILNIAVLCLMLCPCGCERNMRTYPTNYLLLGAFTVTEGILLGVICAHYTLGSVLFAFVATAALVGGLTAFAVYTKRDFTGMGPYLFAALMVLILFGLFSMLLPFPQMQTVYGCFGILLFSFYLIYDTQLIMGKGELAIGIDDYVFAALQLYIDIVQLFLYILELFGDKD